MQAKPSMCATCPLAKQKGYVPGQLSPTARVLVMGSFPTMEDIAHGIPFAGQSGQELRSTYLSLAGLDPETVSFDTALRCAPPLKKGKPALGPSVVAAALKHCSQYDPDFSQYELVIAMGSIALKKLYTGDLKPHELRGHLVSTEETTW